MSEFNFSDNTEGVVAFCLVKKDSQWHQSILQKAEENKTQLEEAGITLAIITLVEDQNVVEELFTQAHKKKAQEALIFGLKEGEDVRYLTMKENPDPDLDWFSAITKFSTNYFDKDPMNGLYRWGQVVPETGEYACRDCGYIEDFQAGDIFPICEACLAGEPDGTSGPVEPFWELLS